jgi:hypothetical protein
MLPYSAARSASFGRPHDAHQRAGHACSSRRIATDSMQLHHAAYAVSCRHTPMTHAYTDASCSIAARPGHGLNSLTLTTATRAAGPHLNVIRPVDARATGLFLTLPCPTLRKNNGGESRKKQGSSPCSRSEFPSAPRLFISRTAAAFQFVR